MEVKDIKKIACLGGGVIGGSWATNFAIKGYPVTILRTRIDGLEESRKHVQSDLDFLVSKGLMTKQESEKAASLVSYTINLEEAVSGAQFIQEQLPEKIEIKRQVLDEVEKYVSPDAVIASSTSGLLITEIADGAKHPERFVGGHPYNPPHLIPLIEVSKGEKTSDEAAKCAYGFYQAIGKEPVMINKEVPGFIANRLQVALYREAQDLVFKGICSVEDIDKAVVYGIGLRFAIMGPNLIFHLGGGEKGIYGLMKALHASTAKRLKDMANWTEEPEGWAEIARDGVDQEIENRTAEQGKTMIELKEYRDNMLIELLKMHKKL